MAVRLAAASGTLGACGGAGTPDAAAVTLSIAALPGTTGTGRYDAVRDVVVLSAGGVDLASATRSPSLDHPGFRTYYDAAAGALAYVGATATGQVTATVVTSASPVVATAGIGRGMAAGLPASGAVSFSGHYVGIVSAVSNPVVLENITGQVTLAADFAAGTVSGSIGGRVGYYNQTNTSDPTYSLNPITLSPASIDAATTFSGAASGGEFVKALGSTSVTSNGRYTGLIGGAAANETAGAVTITHAFGPQDYTEIGVFLAAR